MVVILDMFLLVTVHIVLASETVFNRQERETVCQHCHWCSLTAGRLITWKVPHMNVVAGTFGKNKLVLRDSFSGRKLRLLSYLLHSINEA